MHRGNGNFNRILEACSFKVVCNMSSVGETLSTLRFVEGMAVRIMVQFQKAAEALHPSSRVTVKFVAAGVEFSKTSSKIVGDWYVIQLTATDLESLTEVKTYVITATTGSGQTEATLYGGTGRIEHTDLSAEEE